MRASVTARFGDTMIGVTHVAPDGSYCIGTAPGVDVAIAGPLTSFPIVVGDAHGFMVRRPIGVGELRDGDQVLDEVRLAETIVTFAFERIALTIELVADQAPLAKTALDRRPPKYIAGSLIVHLLVWAIAITFAQLPRVTKKPRPPWVVHPVVARLAPTSPYQYPQPRRLAPPAPAELPPRSAVPSPPVREPREGPNAAASPDPRGSQVDQNGMPSFSPAYIEGLHRTDQAIRDGLAAAGPIYDEDGAERFGNQRQFDPTNRDGWGTVATGRFKTISHGRGTGDEYRLPGEVGPEIALCESPHCEVNGALDKADVQHIIEPMGAALAVCVGQAALTLDLDIAPNGHVKKAHAHGKIGRCAANVIGQLAFPAADGPTHATYTIGYP